jgi:hypothetical protein
MDTDTLVKVGGQELYVTRVTRYMLELSEPFLGSSIVPTLTYTGVEAEGVEAAGLIISYPGTTVVMNHLRSGSKLFAAHCPMQVLCGSLAPSDSLLSRARSPLCLLPFAPPPFALCPLPFGDCCTGGQPSHTNDGRVVCPHPPPPQSVDNGVMETSKFVNLEPDHDCHHDIVGPYRTSPLYRRADNTANQNLYKTSADTVTPLPAGEGLHVTRGSSDVYVVNATRAAVVSGYTRATSAFEVRADGESSECSECREYSECVRGQRRQLRVLALALLFDVCRVPFLIRRPVPFPASPLGMRAAKCGDRAQHQRRHPCLRQRARALHAHAGASLHDARSPLQRSRASQTP